jgi:hypothetical protein
MATENLVAAPSEEEAEEILVETFDLRLLLVGGEVAARVQRGVADGDPPLKMSSWSMLFDAMLFEPANRLSLVTVIESGWWAMWIGSNSIDGDTSPILRAISLLRGLAGLLVLLRATVISYHHANTPALWWFDGVECTRRSSPGTQWANYWT